MLLLAVFAIVILLVTRDKMKSEKINVYKAVTDRDKRIATQVLDRMQIHRLEKIIAALVAMFIISMIVLAIPKPEIEQEKPAEIDSTSTKIDSLKIIEL